MEHNLFKPKDLEEGKHAAVGDCNGYSMEQRYALETPLFAEAILKLVKHHARILDYGCGPGRLAKEILKQQPEMFIDGVDASKDMINLSVQNVMNTKYKAMFPEEIKGKYSLIYCVYVLQHVPAIEIREILGRIYNHLADDGIFIYCSSNYRMAIRYDGQGFFDDRFLGVSLIDEVTRFFDLKCPWFSLFSDSTIIANPILQKMIGGEQDSLAHPAIVFTKKPNIDFFHINKSYSAEPLESCSEEEPTSRMPEKISLVQEISQTYAKQTKKLILVNRLAPGDCLVMTNAIRDLHLAHPGKYLTEVRTPCNEIFKNNPYTGKFVYNEIRYKAIEKEFSSEFRPKSTIKEMDDILVIDMQYPLIHRSGKVGSHFSEGHREYLEKVLDIKIPQTEITPEIYLDQDEKNWRVADEFGCPGRYWVINAGSKSDYGLKQYHRYQEVVAELSGLSFIQIGQAGHRHNQLLGNNVYSALSKTDIRKLFRLIYQAEGVISCVSLPMHVAAAFKKPCVVVAGAREGTRWELYPNQQFLYVNGCLPCASYDGCWRNNIDDCNNKVSGTPKCLTLITPDDIIHSIQRYYDGGMLTEEVI